tara:strand:+ start:630 stop:848 length:219 start_codon:yes stop_codon:yes gene_type:complete
MSNFNVDKILKELVEARMQLSKHLISDSECISVNDDNAEFDEAVLNETLGKLYKQITVATVEVENITGYTDC